MILFMVKIAHSTKDIPTTADITPTVVGTSIAIAKNGAFATLFFVCYFRPLFLSNGSVLGVLPLKLV